MVTNDATILRLKHDVLYEVTKAAQEGNLNEEQEQIPYSMIPGPQAVYRYCIYKEREATRQRIRLAEGKCPTGKDTSSVVQVINAACEECPVVSYIVADNCRKYMGEAYQNSCSFGTISMGRKGAHIESGKCKECGKCSQICPYNVIAHLEHPRKKICPVDAITYDEYGICVTDKKECIQYGACIHSCPFEIIGSKIFTVDVIHLIKAGEGVVTTVAPATEGQFGPDITMVSWKIALKQLGFADMIEAGLGGDTTAAYEAKEWVQASKEGGKMTTSCCPAFVNMIKQHLPMSLENTSTTVSPMCAISRTIENQTPDTVTVFIGPCIAKKGESLDLNAKGNIGYTMTFGEVRAMMRTKGVEPRPAENDYQESSMFGKRFDNGGGVTATVLECLKEMDENTDIKMARYGGTVECKKAPLLMEIGKLSEDLVEGMAYVSGCVGGPGRHRTETEARRARDRLIGTAEERYVPEDSKRYPMGEFSMHRY